MISCWTCNRTNNCKKIPNTIVDIKKYVCEKYVPVPLEVVEARNTLISAVGAIKTIKALKTHRSVSKMTMNPAVQKVVELVESGNVAAIGAFREDASMINSHLMIAACKVTDDPTGVSKQVAEAGADRRGKLIDILLSAASGRAPSITTPVASAPVAPEEPAETAPKPRGRRPASAAPSAPSPEVVSGGGDALIARIDAIGQGQDELSERLKKMEDQLRILVGALTTLSTEVSLLQSRLALFKTGLLNAELEMLGKGKIESAPFGEAMEGWDPR